MLSATDTDNSGGEEGGGDEVGDGGGGGEGSGGSECPEFEQSQTSETGGKQWHQN